MAHLRLSRLISTKYFLLPQRIALTLRTQAWARIQFPLGARFCFSSSSLSSASRFLGGSASFRQVAWRTFLQKTSKFPPTCQDPPSRVVRAQSSFFGVTCRGLCPRRSLRGRSLCPNRMGTCSQCYIKSLPIPKSAQSLSLPELPPLSFASA